VIGISKIGVGLIGCGNISEAYLKAAVQFPIIDMISCADVNADAAQVKAVEYGIDGQKYWFSYHGNRAYV